MACLPGTHPKLQLGIHGPLSAHLRSLWKLTRSPEVHRRRGNRPKMGSHDPWSFRVSAPYGPAADQRATRSQSPLDQSQSLTLSTVPGIQPELNKYLLNEWMVPTVFPKVQDPNCWRSERDGCCHTVVQREARLRSAKDHPTFPRALGILVKKMNRKRTCTV